MTLDLTELKRLHEAWHNPATPYTGQAYTDLRDAAQRALPSLIAEVERLRKIEATARAYVASIGVDGSAAHRNRELLIEALKPAANAGGEA
jgi:hypothetical protein